MMQKEALYNKQEIMIKELSDTIDLSKEQLALTKEKIKMLQNTIEHSHENYSKMLVNYITLLGIFSSILMGAFLIYSIFHKSVQQCV